MTGPAIGGPDQDRAAPSRTGFWDAAGGIVVLLALGLTLRLIIAYLLPGSGFKVDIGAFQFWAGNLAGEGLHGFYGRGFFADYTPGYLYVLWLVGTVANTLGSGVGDLIKVPPIIADLALAYLAWSMVRELGGTERKARIAAALVLFNPITWFDSVVWGQVDSFGVVFLLLALRELWRDRPERSAVLATVAALIKPQLGILIPIVAIVVIRRALWPEGGYGNEGRPERRASTTGWEWRVRGPLRILTTGAAGFITAIALSVPFGLTFFGLVAQIFKTAAGYPYLSVNAFNPWALVPQIAADGTESSIARNRAWVCDSTIVPTGPTEFRIGPWVIPEWSSPGSDLSCPDGVMIGAVPAVLVGAALFLLVAVVAVWLVARRPDRVTMLVGLGVLALAFFVLPTRVHERYLFPLVAIGAILAAASWRWRIAYLLSSAATLANMYVVLTTYYPDNPGISDWLGVGRTLAEWWPIAIAAATQAVVLAWAVLELRAEATERVADEITSDRWLEDEEERWVSDAPEATAIEPGAWFPPVASGLTEPPRTPAQPSSDAPLLAEWDLDRGGAVLGATSWIRARLADPPVRADRSRALDREPGGRLDRLDLWVLALLAVTLLTVRMWRLDEPYEMHFDEVYHPRTAAEFLQDWRYDLPHDIYEWTHPHLAKYAMALGLVAFGEDRVVGMSDLGAAVTDAVIEPRRDSGLDETRVQGDRLWVATGSEVRAYDLTTRDLVATIPLPDAVALGWDDRGDLLYVGTRGGEIRTVDTTPLDAARGGGATVGVEARAFMDLGGPIDHLVIGRAGRQMAAVLEPGFGSTDPARTTIVVIDADAAAEISRPALPTVTGITEADEGRFLVASADGVAAIDAETGELTQLIDVGGPAQGIVAIRDIENDPAYVSVTTPGGPRMVTVIAKRGEDARKDQEFTLPGATAGRVFYDLTSRMVHVEGATPTADGSPGNPTVYVIEPHGNAVYADAELPFQPAVIVLDENQDYPSTDREQLLAIDAGGQVAAVSIGRHAYAWRVPGVIAGVLMALLLYVLARILFRRRAIAIMLGFIVLVDGMLFVQSRIGMNDSYVGLGIIAAYTLFAWLWLRPADSRRSWLAFAVGMPLVGVCLGFALAAKWVAAFAIGGLGLLVLVRSALGRVILIGGLIVLTTVLGYVAISVGTGQSGGNYLFLGIMVALVVVAVIVNVVHPIGWTAEELRLVVGMPTVLGVLAILYGLTQGDAAAPIAIGPIEVTPLEVGFAALVAAGGLFTAFVIAGRFGFGPLAAPPGPDDPVAVLGPPAAPGPGWLRLGAGYGAVAVWLVVSLLVVPLALYVVSYLPWAFDGTNHQIVEGWPPGNAGQTLLDLTVSMYNYHNNLPNPHPASSPWWAWLFDLKPVWFYEEGFAGGTTGSIYDAGNLVAWWLSVPALAFVAWQAFRRRSLALALITIGFAVQWLSWARIDRAAFQYHYYTALPFLFLALAYFLAELWHGASRRTWLLARLAAATAVAGPFLLWLFHRPLCAIAGVDQVVTDSRACPTLIPEVTITPRAIAVAAIVGLGVLFLVRELLAAAEEDEPERLAAEQAAGGWRGVLAGLGLGGRWASTAAIAVGTTVLLLLASALLEGADGFEIGQIPVEPIALVVLLALSPVITYVATARDARRFVVGALAAMGFWFVLWYPNLSGLPLPAAMHNAYQGFLPTYLYPFQFAVNNADRSGAPSLLSLGPAIMLVSLVFMAVVVGYSAWSWRIALAERRLERAAEDDARMRAAAG